MIFMPILAALIAGLFFPALARAADTGPLAFQKGNWWEFEISGATPKPMKTRSEVGGFEDFNGVPSFYFQDRTEMDKAVTNVRTYYSMTPEGAATVGTKTTGESDFGEMKLNSETVTKYSRPVLSYPRVMVAGKQWSAETSIVSESDTEMTGKYPSKGHGGFDQRQTQSARIVRKETIRVPAGEFECFLIESEVETDATHRGQYIDGMKTSGRSTLKMWFSPKVGNYVKMAFRTDSKSTPKDGKTTEHTSNIESVLTKYSVSGAPAPDAVASVPKPRAPAKLTAQVSFEEPSGDRFLDAGETGRLLVTVSNAGPGPAYAVKLSARSSKEVKGFSQPAEVDAGTIEPGKSVSRDVHFTASPELGNGRVSLKLEIKEGNGFDADPKTVEFETRAFKEPKLEIAGLSLGGSGVVKAGEPTTVSLTVVNAGEGTARNASASLDLGSPDIFASSEQNFALGNLAPGESKKVEFEFFVNKRYKGGKELPIKVAVSEAEGRFGVEPRSLGLTIGEAAPVLEVVSVQGRAQAPLARPAAAAEDVDAPPASVTEADPEAYAVVIGIEKYRDVPGVDYAARDAQAVHSYLTRSMGFDPKNVVLLQNERATGRDFDKYLGTWLKNRVTAKSRVFVYYAGHGAPNPKTGEGYLLPYEGDPSYTDDTAYPIKKLYQNLSRLPTRDVIVALDACFSGAGGRSVLAKGARPLVNAVAAAPAAGSGVVVLSASSSDQISTFHNEGRHGLLTYFLLKGLRGGADADGNGLIDTKELFGYVRPAVEREARLQNVEQSPALSPALEALPAEKAGRVWIRIR